jgi:predicted nucleic acid-binding protein
LPLAVVDCSILAATVWHEDNAQEAAAMLAGRDLQAPDLLIYEMANVARNKLRSGIASDIAHAGLLAFEGHRITLHGGVSTVVLDFAGRYGLTAHDAAYLALADQLAAPLFTFDQRLAAAARRHFGDAI